MELTPHFKQSEFAISRSFPALSRGIFFTEIETELIRNFCIYVLEPLRKELRKPIFITSGKRTTKLNTAVAGARNSDHLFRDNCGACDIFVFGLPAIEVQAKIKLLNTIVKYTIAYKERNFVHISFADGFSEGVHYEK